MLYLTALALANVFLLTLIKKRLDRRIILTPNFAAKKEEYKRLSTENDQIKKDNRNLENVLDSIIALYNITERICKSLDANRVFGYFRQELNKYVSVNDCKFVKQKALLEEYAGYEAFPLIIQDELIGYLAVNGLKEQDRDKFYILSQQFILGIKRAILYEGVQALSIIDGLTNIFNRRYYLERFKGELERSIKFKYVFSCLMVDIDHFKSFNDRYGHIVGDVILRELSKTIQENIRQIDLLGRYGGEEFSIILSETDKDAARFAAERIRQAIEDKRIKVYDEELKITVSIGVSTYPYDGNDIKSLIDSSDSALYQAKQAGRNRVCLYR